MKLIVEFPLNEETKNPDIKVELDPYDVILEEMSVDELKFDRAHLTLVVKGLSFKLREKHHERS